MSAGVDRGRSCCIYATLETAPGPGLPSVIEQSVDTGTSAGRALFGMLAVFAQFETDVRRERQAEGIVRAKKTGVYTGGKPRIDRQKVRNLAEAGNGPAAIARDLGVSRMSVYRILREDESATAG